MNSMKRRFHALPHERFAARQADLLDSQLDGYPHDSLDLFEAQNLRTGFPLAGDGRRRRWISQRVGFEAVKIGGFLRFREAVKAAKVAAIGDTHAQVAHDATMRISQQVRANHLGGTGVLVAGELVAGEAIFAPPDCLISTFRS